MIVDFSEIKSKLDKIASSHLNFILNKEKSFLNQISRHIFHEGQGQSSYQTVDNETIEQHLKLISSEFSIPPEDIKTLKIQDVLNHFEKLAVEMRDKQEKMTLEHMKEAIDRVGNVIDTPSKTFAETSLEMLEKIHIDFDDSRDKPSLPTMIVHPSTAEKLKKEEESMTLEDKLTYEKKQQEILNRKYEEYVLRESNRKLVD